MAARRQGGAGAGGGGRGGGYKGMGDGGDGAPLRLSPGCRVAKGAFALVALAAECTDALTVLQGIAALDADGKFFAVRDHG